MKRVGILPVRYDNQVNVFQTMKLMEARNQEKVAGCNSLLVELSPPHVVGQYSAQANKIGVKLKVNLDPTVELAVVCGSIFVPEPLPGRRPLSVLVYYFLDSFWAEALSRKGQPWVNDKYKVLTPVNVNDREGIINSMVAFLNSGNVEIGQ